MPATGFGKGRVVLLRLLARSRRFYDVAGLSVAMCDENTVFALIRDNICFHGNYDPATIEHVVVLLTDQAGQPKMATAECTTRQAATQWCTDPEHKREILRAMLKRLDELYP
jgi:hypothetical protein